LAKISFTVNIKDATIDSYIKLEGQQLYFFNQESKIGKQKWIKSYLERTMKISDIKVEE
jgi:hypothetical protein